MGRVRVRKETGKLYLDFMFQGIRCREQTALLETTGNRKNVEVLMQRIEAKILLGEFDYAKQFPNSKNLKTLAGSLPQLGEPIAANLTASARKQTQTPVFSDFADQWCSEMLIQWRQSHTKNVRSILESSLKPSLGKVNVDQISKADLLSLRSKLALRKGRGTSGRMSPKTINGHMSILRMILAEASERFDFESPYKNINPLKLQKIHIEPFSLQEVQRIIDCVREDYRNYYTVRFYTGMRTGEIDGLKWRYIDFSTREILIRETIIQGRTEYTKTNGSQREIPMLGPVYEALKKQHEATGNISEYVFCNMQGKPLDHCNVTKRVWYPLLRHLALNKRRPYQTRHTAATLLLASGENAEWVARLLGHSSTEMLFKVYSRYIPNLTRMDGSAFERLLIGASPDEAGV